MRDLKFRGFNKASKKWVYGSYFTSEHSETGHCILRKCGFGHHEVDPKSVGQYTGLKNKSGAEAYEGDIIKSKSYPFYSDAPEMEGGSDNPVELNYLGVVGIDVDGVFYDLKVVSDRVSGRACGGNLSELEGDFDIIGNIYENPELLESEDD